jgi:meromycolic acid enoyl-[acyl-carrier-protein] reductase
MTGLLEGKRLLVTGVVTPDSIAFAVAERALGMGAEVVLSALGRDLDQARETADGLAGAPSPIEADLTSPEDLAALTAEVRKRVGALDGALHAVAFAPRAALGSVLGVESAAVEAAMRTSVHSYAALASTLLDLAPETGASLVGLDFAAERAWPTYNWMGVCKAGLEAVNRYLARDLGPKGIRANLVAAGPLVTRAASAIPDFDLLLRSWEDKAPLRWDPADPGPVADAVCFLLSDLSSAVTGEILNVDGGHHAMA